MCFQIQPGRSASFLRCRGEEDTCCLSWLLSPAVGAGRRTSHKEPYLLYVGSRSSYKNFGLLLEAFARSGLAGDYGLLAVGGGEFTTAEQERIARSISGVQSASSPKQMMRHSRAPTAMLLCLFIPVCMRVSGSLHWRR